MGRVRVWGGKGGLGGRGVVQGVGSGNGDVGTEFGVVGLRLAAWRKPKPPGSPAGTERSALGWALEEEIRCSAGRRWVSRMTRVS